MAKIWKVSLPQENSKKEEPINNYVCSQGWYGGDLSWLYDNYRKNKFQDCPSYIRDFMIKDDGFNACKLLWKPVDSSFDNSKPIKARNAFKNLLKNIDAGDIIILYDGKAHQPSYIGEVPKDFIYVYKENLEYPNVDKPQPNRDFLHL